MSPDQSGPGSDTGSGPLHERDVVGEALGAHDRGIGTVIDPSDASDGLLESFVGAPRHG